MSSEVWLHLRHRRAQSGWNWSG